jgi:hypothetical protein
MSTAINIAKWVVPPDVVGYTPSEFAIIKFLVRINQLIRMVGSTFNTVGATVTNFDEIFPGFPLVTDEQNTQMRYMLSDTQYKKAMSLYSQWKPLIEEDIKSLKEEGKESLLSVLDKHDVKAIPVLEKHVGLCASLTILKVAQFFVQNNANRQLHYLFVMLKEIVDCARKVHLTATPSEYPDLTSLTQGVDIQAMLKNPDLQKITNSPFMANFMKGLGANLGNLGNLGNTGNSS